MPSRVPSGKRQLNVLIDAELYNKLVELAIRKTGRLRGGLALVVEEALRAYIEAEERREKRDVSESGKVVDKVLEMLSSRMQHHT